MGLKAVLADCEKINYAFRPNASTQDATEMARTFSDLRSVVRYATARTRRRRKEGSRPRSLKLFLGPVPLQGPLQCLRDCSKISRREGQTSPKGMSACGTTLHLIFTFMLSRDVYGSLIWRWPLGRVLRPAGLESQTCRDRQSPPLRQMRS